MLVRHDWDLLLLSIFAMSTALILVIDYHGIILHLLLKEHLAIIDHRLSSLLPQVVYIRLMRSFLSTTTIICCLVVRSIGYLCFGILFDADEVTQLE